MKVLVKSKDAIRDCSVLVVPVYQGKVKDALQYFVKYGFRQTKTLEDQIAQHKFTGKDGEMLYLATLKTPATAVLVCGLGADKKIHLEKVRIVIGNAMKHISRLKYKDAGVLVDPILTQSCEAEDVVAAVTEAAMLSQYAFKKYKKESRHDAINSVVLICHMSLSQAEVRRQVERGRAIAEAISAIRDFGLEPANELNPKKFADRVKKLSKEAGLECDVLSKSKIESLKMGGLIAVSQGSAAEPRFVVLRYHNKAYKKHVCLVGKGVTFDTGGISLKPSRNMGQMKYDMLGGATATFLTFAAAKLKLPVNVTAIVPLTENSPDGDATRPGDVIRMMSGQTVEVLNTDAEGRLILADALCYAKKLKPDYCIDFATLTGAATIALGSRATAFMGTDRALLDTLSELSMRLYDRFWELPLFDEYSDDLKSDIADLKNIGGAEAGTIIAGMFLSKFAEGMTWAHCDIAATAWSDRDYGHYCKGPTGATVRTVLAWLQTLGAE